MSKRIWKYNENYFETIDTYEKAYWLGFIMADGYIQDNRETDNKSTSMGLRIRLTESEKPHLEKLNKDIESDKPIKIVKNYGVYKNCKDLCEFYLTNTKIVEDLYKIGLTSGNKSCNEKLPKLDNNNLTKNFILGLFDGDGSISFYEYNNRTMIEWQIVSSFDMLNDIKDFLVKELPEVKFQKIAKNSNKKDNGLYRLRGSSKKTIKLLYEYFYLNNCSSSYLERKYNTMKSLYEII